MRALRQGGPYNAHDRLSIEDHAVRRGRIAGKVELQDLRGGHRAGREREERQGRSTLSASASMPTSPAAHCVEHRPFPGTGRRSRGPRSGCARRLPASCSVLGSGGSPGASRRHRGRGYAEKWACLLHLTRDADRRISGAPRRGLAAQIGGAARLADSADFHPLLSDV